MCLQVEVAFSVPHETQRIARVSFPKGNVFMRMWDEFGPIYTDPQFADLFPKTASRLKSPDWVRVAHWIAGQPHARTRLSRFAALAA